MIKHKKITAYLLRAIALLFLIISFNFLLVHLMPGDPLIHILGEQEYFNISHQFPEVLEQVRADYGLDASLLEQYTKYIYRVVTLQFGHSYVDGESVIDVVFFRLKWTLLLSLTSIVISALIGGALGVVAGYLKGRRLDAILTFFALLLETIPANCLAMILLVIFSYKLKWFPHGGMSVGNVTGLAKILSIAEHMILPVSVLTLFRTSTNFLMMKSFVSQVSDEAYITVAITKGVRKSTLLFRHLLRNVMVPYTTMLCMQFGYILSGSMLVEIVFSWKGMGTLLYDAVSTRDYPTVQMCFLIISLCVVFFHFLADALSSYLDPRIKEEIYYA